MNDEAIVRAIGNGDPAAIRRVMDQYSKLLWTIVSAVLSSSASVQDVEECVADVFIYLWEHPEKYDPKRGKLKVWLSVVARSQAIDRYRALARRNDVSLEEVFLADRISAADGLLAKETRAELLRAVHALEELDREILMRRFFHEQKPRQIALAMDLSVKQVENRLYRAKQKLRKSMEEVCI